MDNAVDVWRLTTASRLQRSPVYAGQSIILWWCFIRRPAVAGDGGGTNERKRMAGYSPAASQITVEIQG